MYPYSLPSLPYEPTALEPHIDALTMQIHHGKHHQAYVTNLNNALNDFPAQQKLDLEDLLRDLGAVPEKIRTAVRNNGGGHWNHAFFWKLMAAKAPAAPSGALAAAIDASFGSLQTFKEQFAAAAMGRFGSGWAWLVQDGTQLSIVSTPNQDNPLMEGKKAILGLDVWEHAYYLKYQNRRVEYIQAWWNVLNWDEVTRHFETRG
jgi:Fe-Mn family superoxide dismutase